MAYPNFGTESGVTDISTNETSESVTSQDGLQETDFCLHLTKTISKNDETLTEFGIAASDAGATLNSLTAIITSAEIVKEEQVVGPHRKPTADYETEGGDTPAQSERLTCADDIKWKGYRTTIRIEGDGTKPATLSPGKAVASLKIASATAETAVIDEANLFVTNRGQDENNTEFHRWTAELTKQTAADDADTSPLISSLTLFGDAGADVTDESTHFKLTITKRLDQNGYLTLTETAEIYDDTTTSAIS